MVDYCNGMMIYEKVCGEELKEYPGQELRRVPYSPMLSPDLLFKIFATPLANEIECGWLIVCACAYLNWENVLCAGGAVLGCSLRVPEKHDENNTTRRSYFHDVAYAGSDVGTCVRVSVVVAWQALRQGGLGWGVGDSAVCVRLAVVE